MTKCQIIYQSVLSEIIDGFVKEQRSLGYKYIKGASLLKLFDNYLSKKHISNVTLTKEFSHLIPEVILNETD